VGTGEDGGRPRLRPEVARHRTLAIRRPTGSRQVRARTQRQIRATRRMRPFASQTSSTPSSASSMYPVTGSTIATKSRIAAS
jgi:hypothetical protein